MPRELCVAFVLAVICGTSTADEWGTLRGQVVLDGEVPVLKPILVGPARGLPAGAVVPDDSLVINPQNKGIANVVIWLTKKPTEIHPDFEALPPPTLFVNLTGFRYEPHVLVLQTGQMVQVVNRDPAAYGLRGAPIKNPGFNLLVAAAGATPLLQFRVAEKLPVPISDDIHNWMRAYWLVLDHPYAAVTDRDGYFEIPKLPVGEHEFKVWHERVGYLVKHAADPKKGLIVQIEEGEPIAVPDIRVPVKFEKIAVSNRDSA